MQYSSLTYKEIKTNIYKNFQSSFRPNIQFGKTGNFVFLVKWENLEYNNCTWEDEFVAVQNMQKLAQFFQRKVIEETFGSLNYKREIFLLKKLPEATESRIIMNSNPNPNPNNGNPNLSNPNPNPSFGNITFNNNYGNGGPRAVVLPQNQPAYITGGQLESF